MATIDEVLAEKNAPATEGEKFVQPRAASLLEQINKKKREKEDAAAYARRVKIWGEEKIIKSAD